VEPGRIYHVKRFDVFGLSDLPEEAMTDSPKAGDVYSPARINEWIATIEKRDARRANWGAQFDHAHAKVKIEVKLREGKPKPSPNRPMTRVPRVPDEMSTAENQGDSTTTLHPGIRVWISSGM
jgi:hypothetical protein